jgi:hypothetical protein
MRLIDKNKFLESLNVDTVLHVIDEETLYDSDRMEYKLPMMNLFARLLKLPVIDAVEKDIYEQVRFERDVAIGQLKELGIGLGQKKPNDLERVVRCKNCKHWQTDWKPTGTEHIDAHFCSLIGRTPFADYFCSFGEREENDD